MTQDQIDELRRRSAKARSETHAAKLAAGRADYALDEVDDILATMVPCECDGHTPTPTPTPTPTLPAEPSGFYPAHEFTEEEWLKVTKTDGIPPLASSADTASWRLKLRPSGLLVYDDPVLFYGQPGAAHLHHCYSVAINAFTTHETLMTSSSNLVIQGGPLYHSAIFAPAMINPLENHVINLHGGDLYYKMYPPGHPALMGSETQNVPKGLKFVAKGGTFTLGEYYDQDRNVRWITNAHPTLEAMIAEWDSINGGPEPIPVGFAVRMGLNAPPCWDGENLFLPDSSHIAERVRDKNTGKEAAPPTHPVIIPTPHPLPFFKVLVADEVRQWRLSSDPVDAASGSSVHWDYIEAINDRVRDGMMEIFREHRNASGGPIGLSGRGLLPAPGDGSPARLPIPPRPDHTGHAH